MPDFQDLRDQITFSDFVAQRFFGYQSFDTASTENKFKIRLFLKDFSDVALDIENVYDNIVRNTLPTYQKKILDQLLKDPVATEEFIKLYINSVDFGTNVDNSNPELQGYKLQYTLEEYRNYVQRNTEQNQHIDPFDLIVDQIKAMGNGFEPYFDFIDTDKKIRNLFLRDGKFRDDSGPTVINRYQCRIGASTFFVPPTNISVYKGFKAASIGGGTLRQPNSTKTNLGHSETSISLTLYFPNHETIWGFRGDTGSELDIFNWDPEPIINTANQDVEGFIHVTKNTVSDKVIDNYLSSLRGLVTQFRYSPILPIKNEFLNRSFDIDAVALAGMTVSTLPDFPFVLVVNLQLLQYNYNPLLPMVSDFDQAIHWGKFRQYMGRAAARLDAKVNQGFLTDKTSQSQSGNPHELPADLPAPLTLETPLDSFTDLVPTFDKVKDIMDGRNFSFYYPISDPARIFAPDTTDFRQPGEDAVVTKDIWDFILGGLGFDLVQAPTFNFFEYDRSIRSSKYRNEAKVTQQWLNANRLAWNLMNPEKLEEFIEEQIANGTRLGDITPSNESFVRENLKRIWFLELFRLVIEDDPSLDAIKRNRNIGTKYTINEWEIPMEKLYIDWSHCIVTGVGVSLKNTFAKLQIQLQDEPTYQHLGGGDSTVEVNMVVIGEENLIRFRRLFEHINGLARLEHAHGVLGFLGIKNVITSLCGIKYVLPLDFEVETIENFPHVYNVRISLIDFDVMQQEREKISSDQQAELIETFGKRNPFLRLKQCWGVFNGYPDLPLEVRDEDGKIIGHLDPDWYFRSFTTSNSDSDLFNWDFDPKVVKLIQGISQLQFNLEEIDYSSNPEFKTLTENQISVLETQLRDLLNQGAVLPSYWQITDGKLERVNFEGSDLPEPEMTVYLGVFNEDQSKSAILSFFPGGYIAVGSEDIKTKEREYKTGISYLKEDLASDNLTNITTVDGLSSYPEYQKEYLDDATNPNRQYQAVMMDYNYRNLRGRMLRAFPTYMLWLIDEGGRFAGIKLYDNFYGLNSVIDFSVVSSEDATEDSLVLRLSNTYGKLTNPYREDIITEDDPLYDTAIGQWIVTSQNRMRNLASGLTDTLIELNNIRLKPGVRIHLRAGYSSNPNALQTIFNGVIAEVQQGDVITVVAQSDAIELTGLINTVNSKGDSGKLDGGLTGLWMSEPRDLMVRLLTMGSSKVKEAISWASKGVFYSDSRFGIRHFGTILYEPMTSSEGEGTAKVIGRVGAAMQSSTNPSAYSGILGPLSGFNNDLANTLATGNVSNIFSSNLLEIGKMLWINSFAKRDYEIFKRNIYPGNGCGIAQFMGGDQIDAGITVTSSITVYDDGSASVKSINNDLASQSETLTDEDRTVIRDISSTSEANTNLIWDALNAGGHIEDSEVLEFLETANKSAFELNVSKEDDDIGLLDVLLAPLSFTFDTLSTVNNFINDFIDDIPILSSVPGASTIIKSFIPGFGTKSIIANTFENTFQGLVGGIGRLASGGNTLGFLLGLASPMADDDLHGFDEVSFRAQTYMKTVWDMFETCAALLPNYIVAVRPFEDRSTVFYGKPHWLYTSGVIPVTKGIPKDKSLKPGIEEADRVMQELLRRVSQASRQEAERAMTIADDTAELRSIMSFIKNGNFDPFNPAGDSIVSEYLTSEEDLQALIASTEQQTEGLFKALSRFPAEELRRFSLIQLQDLVRDVNVQYLGIVLNSDSEITDEVSEEIFYDLVSNTVNTLETRTKTVSSGIEIFNGTWAYNSPTLGQLTGNDNDISVFASSISSPESKQAFMNFVDTNPMGFAFQFGWKFNQVPVYVNPVDGYGIDKIGEASRRLWDSGFDQRVSPLGDKRSDQEANDIWDTVRSRRDNLIFDSKEVFQRFFPMDEMQDRYEDIWETFVRFLWQDPYNRAWVIITADKVEQSLLDPITPEILGGDTSNHWGFSRLLDAFEVFIQSGDVEIDQDTKIVSSQSTKQWMNSNARPGDDAHYAFTGIYEDISNWWDENIGALVGMIADTMAGFIQSIRMSLAQMGNALGLVGEFQRQANIMNASLYDSIYYQMGEPGSLLRLVDNPFTREYGEPVVEIREPFQRLHYASSFDNILNNSITENLSNVATTVTAITDGKHPVTVHLDKGISPERQVERTVETGLLWDNAVGNGLFGFLQPLLHPLETLRAVTKIASGSSDELSARRVALWHLKESLKDIYTGELLLLGDADIRPHDLLYIADVYERMYGMVEVEKVIHHFSPETGFVTAVTPNALVTINDPVRWSLLSYVWGKMSSYNIRDDMRAFINIKTDRTVAQSTKEIDSEEIYKNFSTQINGSIQYSHGNSAIIRDMGAIFSAGGFEGLSSVDRQMNQVAWLDLSLAATKAGLPLIGAGIGSVGGIGGAAVGGGAGWLVGDLMWEAWQWVKENLLDQHGCYISYLNKDGQPMDAGLSYFQGVAVGTNHTIKLLPAILGATGKVNYKENGHFRITNNDLLASLGWTEVETVSLFRETSMFVNEINRDILKISGRDSTSIPNDDFIVILAKVISPYGETIDGALRDGIEDGDTLNVMVIDGGNSFTSGRVLRVRLGVVDTYELADHSNPEIQPSNDLGKMAYDYVFNKFANETNRYIAIRINKRNMTDAYGRTIGMVFCNAPLGTPPSERSEVLLSFAKQFPPIGLDNYLPDGRPYTLNWELVMVGLGNVDMRESLWNTSWRQKALNDFS